MTIFNQELEDQIRANISQAVEIAIRNAPASERTENRAEITKIVSSVLGLSDSSQLTPVAGQETQSPTPVVKDK